MATATKKKSAGKIKLQPLGDRVVVMNEGWKRQADTPLNIYRHPADRFVAGFLGMPPMNFLQGHLESDNSGLSFISQQLQLKLPNDQSDRFNGDSQKKVVAGIRPEAIEIHQEQTDGISATVQVVEPLGSNMDVYLQLANKEQLVCRVPAQDLTDGQTITASIAPNDIHLFEPNEQGDRRSATYYGRSLTS